MRALFCLLGFLSAAIPVIGSADSYLLNQKNYHPVGTLVYILTGKAVSNVSGQWKTYSDGSYWFEPSMWKHCGIDTDEPKFGDDQCTETLVIRAARKSEEPTVFIK